MPEIYTEIFNWLRIIFQILIFSVICYWILRGLRGTRGLVTLCILTVPFILLGYFAYFTRMPALNAFVHRIFTYLPLLIIILFQNEIRRMLMFLGSQKYVAFKRIASERKRQNIQTTIDEIIDCVCNLTKKSNWRMYIDNPDSNRYKPKTNKTNIGALIAVENTVGLDDLIRQSGVPLECHVNSMLLQSLFFPNSPLHDGGVIIRGTTIVGAGCQFPPSTSETAEPIHTRHNAAKGLAETSDAMVIVVSEETGNVSVTMQNGHLKEVESPRELNDLMQERFLPASQRKNVSDPYAHLHWWERYITQIIQQFTQK